MLALLFGNKPKSDEPIVEEGDPTAWLIDSSLSEFLLLHTNEIRYMAMLAYTFLHGCKLFPTLPPNSSHAYKLAALAMQCTGGGILVPVFVNLIPVTLGQDAYPICIFLSFLMHTYLPILREILHLSPIFKTAMIVLYESQRASVVCKLTKAAAAQIPASDFSFAVFGPIICGGIAGCGGAFLPLNKGLGPIESGGLAPPMSSALLAAAFLHLFLHTSASDGVENAAAKAQVVIAVSFIAFHLSTAFPGAKKAPPAPRAAAKDKKKR